MTSICDRMRANEALWGRYQNWHFKFNILFNVQGIFWHQNDFHIIFLSKVRAYKQFNLKLPDHLNINYWDIGKQSYWFVHKPIEDIKNNWMKTIFCYLLISLGLWAHNIYVNPCSPEGFSQTYFPKGGLLQPPLDYQYWRSYNSKFTTSV